MGKVAIVTDSNSGITQAEGKKMGIYVLPMPFYINEELFYEDITLTQEEFYEKEAVRISAVCRHTGGHTACPDTGGRRAPV